MSDADLASKKKLTDLKVKDLRQQLEKRNLDRNGNKTALVERLTKALQSEGYNPDEFLFDVAGETGKTPVKSPALKRPSRKNRDSDSVQDEGDAEDDDEEDKQAEQEDKKELNKDQDIQDEKQDVNKLNNPGDQKVLQCNGDKEESSQVSSQLAPEKSQLAPVIPSVAVEDATKLGGSCSNNAGDSVSVGNAEDAKVAVSGRQNVESECQPVKDKPSESTIENKAEAMPKMSNDSSEVEVTNSLTKHEVEKTKTVIGTDVKDAPSKRTDRESTETSTAATDEKSNPEASSQNAAVKEETEGLKNLWICGLNSKTRAADLKSLFSAYGKVNCAKIVTSAKTPTSRFGFVIMATCDGASAGVEHVHNTKIDGEIVSVEKKYTTRDGKYYGSAVVSMENQEENYFVKHAARKIKKNDIERVWTTQTARELHEHNTIKQIPAESPPKPHRQQSKEDASPKQSEISSANNEIIKKEDEDSSKTETKKKGKETETGKAEIKGEKKKSDGGEERKSRKVSSRDRFTRSRMESRGWRESRIRAYGRVPQRGRFYRTSGYSQRSYGRNYNDYREREMRRPYTSRSRYSESINTEELRLEHEKQMLRLEKEKIELERLKLEKEKHRFEREQLELERAELRARKFSQSLPEHRAMKRSFEGHRLKGEGRHWSERKRSIPHDSFRGSHSPGRYNDYSRERLRSDSFEGRPKNGIRLHLSGPSRHAVESRMFARGRREEPDEKRLHEDWKSSKDRGNFERSSRSRGFPGRHDIDSPSPWNSPTDHELKFSSASVSPPGQWSPVKSDNWGRLDGPPPKRWAGGEPRGQLPMGHPHNQQGMFGGSGNAMMSNMPAGYPIQQFSMDNVITRF